MVCCIYNVNGTKNYAQKLKNSMGNFFLKWSQGKMSGSPWQQNKHTVLALFMVNAIVQKLSVWLHFSQNQVAAIPPVGSVLSLDRYEASADLCILRTTSPRTHIWGTMKLGGVDKKDQLLQWGKEWISGTWNCSEGYSVLQFSVPWLHIG